MKRIPTDRRIRHLDRGDDVFIPEERVAAIRWEESVLRSQLAREGVRDPSIMHGTCHCGSIECVGVPHARTGSGVSYPFPSDQEGVVVVARKGVIINAHVEVTHDPDGRYAVRLYDPAGCEHRVVIECAPSPRRWRGPRTIAMPELSGAEVTGTWRLVVLDHTRGEGELRRAWRLVASLR